MKKEQEDKDLSSNGCVLLSEEFLDGLYETKEFHEGLSFHTEKICKDIFENDIFKLDDIKRFNELVLDDIQENTLFYLVFPLTLENRILGKEIKETILEAIENWKERYKKDFSDLEDSFVIESEEEEEEDDENFALPNNEERRRELFLQLQEEFNCSCQKSDSCCKVSEEDKKNSVEE